MAFPVAPRPCGYAISSKTMNENDIESAGFSWIGDWVDSLADHDARIAVGKGSIFGQRGVNFS